MCVEASISVHMTNTSTILFVAYENHNHQSLRYRLVDCRGVYYCIMKVDVKADLQRSYTWTNSYLSFLSPTPTSHSLKLRASTSVHPSFTWKTYAWYRRDIQVAICVAATKSQIIPTRLEARIVESGVRTATTISSTDCKL